MKRQTLLLAALAAGFAAVAGAQAPPGPPDASFAGMDADGDGAISGSEHADAAKRMFDTMDGNDDDDVTAEEMDAAQARVSGRGPRPGELSAAAKIVALDTNGDGILSAGEHADGAAAMFTKMDANRDGELSPGELEAGHAAIRKEAGG